MDEWKWIYGPLAAVLFVAVVLELRTERIPNLLTVAAFIYVLAARWIVGPVFPDHLMSALIGIVLMLGIGWKLCGLGGGAAKLAVAVAAGMPPWMALILSAALIVLPYPILMTKVAGNRQTFPGSILVSVVAIVVVSVAAFTGAHA